MTPHRSIHRALDRANRSVYRIGCVTVELLTSVPEVAAAYRALYGPFAIKEPGTEEDARFQVRVYRKRSWRTGLAHYHIESDVDETFTVRHLSRVMPHVEGAINLCIARTLPRYLLLHAAALTCNGVGVIAPGGPGFGKTTLAAALTSRGWQYGSDEFAMIEPRTGTLVPYPKAFSIKSGACELLRSFGLPIGAAPAFDRTDKGEIRLLPARAIRGNAIAGASRVGLIVFPTLAPGAAPMAMPMSQAEAVFEMTRRCFNLLRFRSQAIEILAEVVRGAHCYRIRTGDLRETCRMMEALADRARAPQGPELPSLSAA